MVFEDATRGGRVVVGEDLILAFDRLELYQFGCLFFFGDDWAVGY